MRNLETGAPLPEHAVVPKRPYTDTLQFLYAAQQAKVPEKVTEVLSPKPLKLERFEQGYSIAMRYFTTNAYLPELSDELNMPISRVLEKKNKAVTTVWNYSPPVMRMHFPINELTLRKPRNETSNRKIAQSKNGISIRIEKALESGMTVEEIENKFGLDSKHVQIARRALGKWGTKLPYIRTGYTVLENAREMNLEKAGDEKKQTLLDSVTLGIFMTHHGKGEFLASLKEVVEKSGYKYVNHYAHSYLEELRFVDIPLGKATYIYKSGPQKGTARVQSFILRADLDRAVMALKYNPKFDRYKKEDYFS